MELKKVWLATQKKQGSLQGSLILTARPGKSVKKESINDEGGYNERKRQITSLNPNNNGSPYFIKAWITL